MGFPRTVPLCDSMKKNNPRSSSRIVPGTQGRDQFLAAVLFLIVALLAMFIPLGKSSIAWAHVLLDQEHLWAVESAVPEGTVIEYVVCDLAGQCNAIGMGDQTQAGTPILLDTPFVGDQTLHARFCVADSAGNATHDCGALSAAGMQFLIDSRVTPSSPYVTLERTGFSAILEAGETYTGRIPLGMAPPVIGGFRFESIVGPNGARFRLRIRSAAQPTRIYFDEEIQANVSPYRFWRMLSAELTTATKNGETELEYVIDMLDGVLWLLQIDPLIDNPYSAPHFVLVPRFGDLIANWDADGDGVPYSVGDAETICHTDRWVNCLDNCPDQYNPRQTDLDVDGVGDICDPTPGQDDDHSDDVDPDQIPDPNGVGDSGGGTGPATDPIGEPIQLFDLNRDAPNWQIQGGSIRDETTIFSEGDGSLRLRSFSGKDHVTAERTDLGGMDLRNYSVVFDVFVVGPGNITANDGIRLGLASGTGFVNRREWRFGSDDGVVVDGWATLSARVNADWTDSSGNFDPSVVSGMQLIGASQQESGFKYYFDNVQIVEHEEPREPQELLQWNMDNASTDWIGYGATLIDKSNPKIEGTGSLRMRSTSNEGIATAESPNLNGADWRGLRLRFSVWVDHATNLTSSDGVRVQLSSDNALQHYREWRFGTSHGLRVDQWATVELDLSSASDTQKGSFSLSSVERLRLRGVSTNISGLRWYFDDAQLIQAP